MGRYSLILLIAVVFFLSALFFYLSDSDEHQKGYYRWSPKSDTFNDGKPVAFEARFLNRRFEYVMHKPLEDICGKRKIRTLVFIVSGAKNARKRQAIRDSWMNDESNPADYLNLFLVGQTSNVRLSDQLADEQAKYGDIVRYSYEDLYDLLPLKVHAALSWFNEFCSNASYLLKTDDDTVVYEKRLDHFMTTEFNNVIARQSNTVFCKVREGETPIRLWFDKYYVPRSDFSNDTWPPHCLGCSYMLSRNAVFDLLQHTRDVKFTSMEDVLITGIVLKQTNVQLYNSKSLGSKVNEPVDPMNEPYLTTVVGLDAEKIAPAFSLLKNVWTARLLDYDYHHRRADF